MAPDATIESASKDPVTARPAFDDEVPAIAAMLARAFADDPLSEFFLASRRRRPRGLKTFFAGHLRTDVMPFAGAYTVDGLRSAALWIPPGKPPPTTIRALRSLVPMLAFLVGRHFTRAMRFVVEMERIHPKEPHWYLSTLGTDPPFQGTGLGSSVIKPVLERCDRTGVRAYLESSKEENVPLYRRHGFEVADEVRLAGSPPLWLMWREPRPVDPDAR
jgi:ribosomal protein S18 acetylase RimI-like enzyme